MKRMKMPNKDIEKILPALAAIGGAVGRAAMAGGRAMAADKIKDKIGQTAGTAMEIADPSNEQDAHAQTEWENIHRSKSIQKLMSFVQIQKLGYAEGDRRKRPVRNPRYGGWDTRQPQDLGSQSAGLPAHGSKEWDKLLNLWERTGGEESDGVSSRYWSSGDDSRETFPLERAHNYLDYLQGGETTTLEDTMLGHLVGHQALADVHNLMQFGEDWKHHPDRLEYMVPSSYDQIISGNFMGEDGWTNMGEGIQRPSRAFVEDFVEGGQSDAWFHRIPFATFQREVLPAVVSPKVSNKARGIMDDLHRRIRMESPQYNPNDMTFPRLQDPRSARGEPVSEEGVFPPGEQYGSSRSTYGTETTPLPGRGTPDDVERQTVEPHDRGPARPFEDFPYAETEEGGVVPRGINQGQIPREMFDDFHGNPTRYWSGRDSDDLTQRYRESENLPDELRVNYPSAEARMAAYGGPEGDSREAPKVPPPIPGDPPSSPLGNAFEQWRPDLFRDKEKAVAKLQKFLFKEGAVGGESGGFDGLSDTVFTSTNAGIFTPTFGGKHTKKKHKKHQHRQEKKRKKLMGKEKKSGVERLVQYLYEGSPHISKAGKMGLAPGLDDDMTGDGATAHAGKNNPTGPMRVHHKKTDRPIVNAMKVAENNEPHINMGLAGNMEASIAAAYPQEEDPSVMNASMPRKAEWNNKAYVQKAANEATTFISPDGGNESADGAHPQKAFVERTKDSPNESPHKDAVTKENDMQRRVKKYDNKEEDTGHEQPAGVMAAAGMGGYPSGATMQMSSFGFNTYEQDALARGGEEDKNKDGQDNDRMDEEGNVWVPQDPDKAKATLESMRKALEDAGDEAPLLTALHKLDFS